MNKSDKTKKNENIDNWWMTWAPFWDLMENRHMSTHLTDKIINLIKDPILVIGAGQGVIVKHLKDKGFIVDGLDLEDEMIKYAKKRHNLNLIKGDARDLPFNDNLYNTVIISSGVVDYITDKDEALIKEIIIEALRVTSLHGNLFLAFHQQTPAIEKIYKTIGVINKDNILNFKRIMDIDKYAKKSPLKCVPLIMDWTKKSKFWVIVNWSKIGLTLPKELKYERNHISNIFDIAEKEMGIKPEILYDCMPENVPYRSISDIKELFNRLNIFYNSIERYDDCVLTRIYKSSIYNIDFKVKKDSIKNWIIKTENLSKKYKGSKKNAIDMLNLTIKKGDIFGLLGPNGAGKTTTLSLLCGIIKPTGGNIYFEGKQKFKNIKEIVGYIPQELALYPRLSAIENLKYFGKLYKIKNNELKERINRLLGFVGLENRAHEPIKKYSTGMMRRLNLAVGLINNPKIILMDEPTVGIDPQSRNLILEAILKLKKKDITILYTTHYMEEADRLCDTVAIIDNGKILIEGNPKELVKEYGFNRINFTTNSKISQKLINELMKHNEIYNVELCENSLTVSSIFSQDNIGLIYKINDICKKMKVKLNLTTIDTPTLESLFLDITGRHLRDTLVEDVCL